MKFKYILALAGALLATSAMAAPKASPDTSQNDYATELFRKLQLYGN